VVDERRLARRLRAEDLDDPASRQTADPERRSSESEPVEMAAIETCAWSFIFMTDPLPN